MKCVNVSAAVILHTNPQTHQKEVFATARGYGDYKGWWEFPGGKLEEGETAAQCIVREIKEELDSEVSAGEELGVVEYDYPAFHLTMHCILCELKSGALTLLEHEDAKWLSADNLMSVKWLPADELILKKVKEKLSD